MMNLSPHYKEKTFGGSCMDMENSKASTYCLIILVLDGLSYLSLLCYDLFQYVYDIYMFILELSVKRVINDVNVNQI